MTNPHKMFTVIEAAKDIDAIARVSKLVDDAIAIERNEADMAEMMRDELDALTNRATVIIADNI